MAHSHTKHTSQEYGFSGITVRASFWPADNGGPINSIFKVSQNGWDVQVDATAADLRALALALVTQAEALDVANKSRDSLAADFCEVTA